MERQPSAQNKPNEKKAFKGNRNPSPKTAGEQRLDEAKTVHDQIYGNSPQKDGTTQKKA